MPRSASGDRILLEFEIMIGQYCSEQREVHQKALYFSFSSGTEEHSSEQQEAMQRVYNVRAVFDSHIRIFVNIVFVHLFALQVKMS